MSNLKLEQNVYFTDYVADYGSAMYVNDSTNIGTCAALQNGSAIEASQSQCFFQQVNPATRHTIVHKVFNFTNNVAGKSGKYLYGGLLRCKVDAFGTKDKTYTEQTGAFDHIRDFTTSDPVRMFLQ